MPNLETISAQYRTAKECVTNAQTALRAQSDKLDTLKLRKQDAEDELERLLGLEQSDHVSRILNGEDTAPKRPKRLTRIANLHDSVAGIELALPIQIAKVESAQSSVEIAQSKLSHAVLPDLLAWKSAKLKNCSQPLIKLLDSLAEVAAADLVQQSLSGPNGEISISEQINAEDLFSGTAILKKFEKSLPPRFVKLAADHWPNLPVQIQQKAADYIKRIGD